MNPTNFLIPATITQDMNLPGERRMRKKGGKYKRPYHEIDSNGCVQLSRITGEPIKLCHLCGISSRKAQLIMCDFCPLLYHADCLNPPLKYPPSTKWMCPVHPESMLLQNRDLFQSQRKAIADLFSEKLNPSVIITELLKKRQRSTNLRKSNTSMLLNNSSIEVANVESLPKKKSIVPPGIKKAYKTRRFIETSSASEKEAELFLSCIPNFGRKRVAEEQKKVALISDEAPRTPEEVELPEKYSCLLMPIGVDALPFFVTEPISKIGTSPDNQIVLTAKKCETISPHHAVLYEDISGNWELLNYSIHGMTVNGVEYGLEEPDLNIKADDSFSSDFTERIYSIKKGGWIIKEDKKLEWISGKSDSENSDSDDESKPADEITNQNLAKVKKSPCPSPTPSHGSEKSKFKKRSKKNAKQEAEVVKYKCGCPAPEPGWESPVQLTHGSVIQFGCNKYLFVCKDDAVLDDNEEISIPVAQDYKEEFS